MTETYSTNSLRLFDVFISGPLYLILATYVDNIILKAFVYLVGLCAIVFNGWNFFHFEDGTFNNSIGDSSYGKTQFHRLFNLAIMYPLLAYITYTSQRVPSCLRNLVYLLIVGGFALNLYYFIVYSK